MKLTNRFLSISILILRSRCPLWEIVIQRRSRSLLNFEEDGSIRADSHQIKPFKFNKLYYIIYGTKSPIGILPIGLLINIHIKCI